MSAPLVATESDPVDTNWSHPAIAGTSLFLAGAAGMAFAVVGALPMVAAFVVPLVLAAVYAGRRILPLVVAGLPAATLTVWAVVYWSASATVTAAVSVAVGLAVAASFMLVRRGAGLVPGTEHRTGSSLRDLAQRLAQAPAPGDVADVVASAVGEALELRGVEILVL